MGNKIQEQQGRWWNRNWHQHVWVVTFVLIAMMVIAWAVWATSFGVTVGVDREKEINTLIANAGEWQTATAELRILRQVMLANPMSIDYPVQTLTLAENKVDKTASAFETAGFKALSGEMIIISGVMLQIFVTFYLMALARVVFGKKKVSESINNDRINWVEKFRSGQAFDGEDDILKFVGDEAVNSLRPKSEFRRGEQVSITYRKLIEKCRKATDAEIPWQQISNMFYKLALICKERGDVAREMEVRVHYKKLRQIVRRDLWNKAGSIIGSPLIFIMIFTLVNYIWIRLVDVKLGGQLDFWREPILLVGAAFLVSGVVHMLGDSMGRWFTERTWTDLDDVIIGAVVGPLSALAMVVFLLVALHVLTGPNNPPFEFGPFLSWVGYVATKDVSRTVVVIFAGTWFAVFFLNRILVWFMEQWARKTSQLYDDMFVKIVQVFGTFVILAFGAGAGLAVFNGPLSEATGVDNIILPYTIIVSVFTAIVGYAASAGFENFFGGLLLQVEKPFDRGERIVLPDGQICDVREIGMRSTVLYNVTENTEVSVPNSVMSKMIITNTSRPDLELRIAISNWIKPKIHNLKIAGAILLDIAYLEREIDQMRVFKDELTDAEQEKNRRNTIIRGNRHTIEQGMDRLVVRHEKIKGTIVSQIVGGGGKQEPGRVFREANDLPDKLDPYLIVLNAIKKLRKDYRDLLERENKWIIDQIAKVEVNAEEKLRDYRRAINEIAYSEYSDAYPVNNVILEVAHHERLDINKLTQVLFGLSGLAQVGEAVDGNVVSFLGQKLNEFEAERLGVVLHISDEVAVLQNYIYAIGEQFPDVRPELDFLISELDKEPSVSSEYTDDGQVHLTLSCYAVYLERKLQIQHKINRDIEWRFNVAGIGKKA